MNARRWVHLLSLAAMGACGGDIEREATENRAPTFPDSVAFETGTSIERNAGGAPRGAMVSVRTNARASDSDGDSLVYRWEGSRFNGDALVPATLDTSGFTVRFRSGVLMDQAAGGVLLLIATDPKGRADTARFCVPGGGFTC